MRAPAPRTEFSAKLSRDRPRMRFVSGGVCRLVRIDPDDDHGVRVSPQERPHRRLSSEVSLERASGVAGWFSLGDFLVVLRAAGCRSRSSVAGLHSGTAPLAHHDRRRNPNRTSDFGGSGKYLLTDREATPPLGVSGWGWGAAQVRSLRVAPPGSWKGPEVEHDRLRGDVPTLTRPPKPPVRRCEPSFRCRISGNTPQYISRRH